MIVIYTQDETYIRDNRDKERLILHDVSRCSVGINTIGK